MRLLIAPDSFKGTLSAVRFCQIAAHEITRHWPHIEIIQRPLSDGGEGFIDALVHSECAQAQYTPSQDPLGRPIQAQFAWQSATRTAFIEMAQSGGLTLLPGEQRNPLHTTTYGAGLLIQAALDLGAQTIVLGLGGSATHDGGAGALQALGIALLDKQQQPIAPGAQGLLSLHHIGPIPAPLRQIRWQLACDVTNPLTGPHGAAYTYAKQKGAQDSDLPQLDHALAHFARQIHHHHGRDVAHLEGSGAAGGMAAGFIGLLNAESQPGFNLLAHHLQLVPLFQQGLDLVITGEGRIDAQTAHGKLPWRLANLAQSYQVPTLALAGEVAIDPERHPEFLALLSLCQGPSSLDTASAQVENWLRANLTAALRLFFHQPSARTGYTFTNKTP
ncbi:MAG: glycerate kinase [Thiomicrospira sp.]|jgi:glycerate kinase|nr:glycerate kinase [Thiomicrospira sp.]